MKYLSDYMEEEQSKILSKMGAFFAFSPKQFNDQSEEGVKYVSMGAGLICPKDNAAELLKKLIDIGDRAQKQDLAENGKDGVIERELYNHEAPYTGQIESTIDALDGYGITRAEIIAVFNRITRQDY